MQVPIEGTGRPRRRKKRVKYEESSFESKSDSDYNPCPPKPSKITPGSGPSKDRLRAHRFMKNKGKLNTPKTTLPPIVPNRNVAHTGVSSGLAKNTKSDNTSAISRDNPKSSKKDDTPFDHEGSKPKGSLSVSHHGLKKF